MTPSCTPGPSSTRALFESIQAVANSIVTDTAGIFDDSVTVIPTGPVAVATDILHLTLPEPLTHQLMELGLPRDVAECMSQAYIREAEGLRTSTEETIRRSCFKLASLPRPGSLMPIDKLQRRVFDAHHQNYKATLASWAQDAKDIAHSRFSSASTPGTLSVGPSTRSTKNSKRKFKSEYLPLFEFAFEKDRFPSREDKKHLAKITSMSYRQVCVWFQNRRCRHASRVKSQQHMTPPPPQTFEEMKRRLGASAREALGQSRASVKRESERGGSVLEGRETSLGVSEEEGDEERDELADDDDMMPTITSPLSPPPPNPLMSPLKTPTASVFPAPYKPSELTFDPFIVVEPQPWVRHPLDMGISARAPTLDAVMGGFESMDVGDVEMPDEDEEEEPARAVRPLPRRWTPLPVQRSFSSSSLGSSGSRASSYSTAPSSVVSSPRLSEVSLPAPSECVHVEEEEQVRTAGLSDFSGKINIPRVSAWVTGVGVVEGEDRWEQLVAAATVASA